MKRRPYVAISKRFTFNSAHNLPGVSSDHPCDKLHGHTYTVEVEVRGHVEAEVGWLIDFEEIKQVVQPLVDQLDHSYLNEIEGLKHTTAEELAVWFWERIKPRLPSISRVTVMETPANRCDFYGEYGD